MDQISDYILTENIHESRSSVIYRGHRINENQPVIIKLLKTKKPSPDELARFKQEYNLIKNLNLEKIVKTLDFVEDTFDEDTFNYAIIEEDFNGISLKKLLKTRTISLQNFLGIAITLSETLSNLHKNNIIHMDIKPDNILINTEENIVKITDFGISALLTHANDEIYNPAVIQGTLAYMSPEQTGRMNRSMDYRTDLYSLGITFYEMLTGKLPFKSKDPIELIHSHIARQPTAPRDLNPDIPTVISSIILKLLAKSPEERYQNASGLAFDLTECLNQLTRNGTIDNFTIAQKDISIRFNIPQHLVGRELESANLMESFERASLGTGEMMLVTGSPGIGKSALVNELYKPIVAKKGYFISSKYDQFKRDIPYSSIIQAFQSLIRQIIAESEDRVHSLKNKLLSALGSNGKVLISVIPELEYVIGKQPDVPDLNPEESQNRFNLLFQKFVNVFISPEQPNHFFFIGAYRDTETDQNHPLMIMFNEIVKHGTKVNNITLKPLDIDNINTILVNVFRCKAEQSIELAELVHRKTAGNPFFVNQFLKSLYDKKVLSFNPKDGWNWNIDSIIEMQVTDNVVEFMATKISSLPKNTQDILKICSCIGNRFDLEELATVSEKTMEAVLEDLSLAIREDLVRLCDGIYKFHHDRIQEAAYSLIPESEKAQMHYRIGSSALKKTDSENLNKKIFYIVDQLNRGSRFLIDYEMRFNLMSLNEQAAGKAKSAAAYYAAAEYLEKAKSLLSTEEWGLLPHKLFSISIQYAECLYLSGNIDKALDLCEQLFELATDNFDKGGVYSLKIRILDATYQQLEAVLEEVRKGLALFGVSLPADNQEIDKAVKEGIAKMKAYFAQNPIEKLIELPHMTDKNNVMVMKLLLQAAPSVAQTNFQLFSLIELLMFELAISYGTTAESCKNFVDLGLIHNAFLGDYERSYQLSKVAFALIDKYNADSLKSSVYFVFSAYISCWRSHYREGLDYYDLAYQSGLETGDLLHVSYSSACKLFLL
ncbi:MAG: serine/threonine-protein kinase PknK, partial [Fibrobacter sp.]|nr:serine/threonine-protein kinase PknK [Fibrobacter sp.]